MAFIAGLSDAIASVERDQAAAARNFIETTRSNLEPAFVEGNRTSEFQFTSNPRSDENGRVHGAGWGLSAAPK